ncbi:MAG: penicillin-binding protein 2 [candidate division Zixibacteria bacterium]|nr:penicillin-binding protein 2 [candidate division Zixibacteria bacterium]
MYRVQGRGGTSLAVAFVRRRRLLLGIGLCVWGAVWARALQLQIMGSTVLSALAEEQSDRRVCLAAPRGEIVDRQGRLLAINVAKRSFFAYPDRETPTDGLARHFASVRGQSFTGLSREWKKRHDRFTWMLRRCSATTAASVTGWQLPGVYATWEYERVYPTALTGIAGPLGFVNDSLNGAAGLEAAYDGLLRGADGVGLFVADANGHRFAVDPVAGRPPVPGRRLRLTLDARWQSILAEELDSAVTTWQARSGMALLMDPHTGAILAMVDIDPSRPPGAVVMKNRLVSDVFEPGSTFKVVTYAGALSDGVVYPGRFFDGGNGSGLFSGRPIHDDKPHGVITVAEAFAVSSNVVTGRIANRLDLGRLDFWVRRFGFGDKTGIDLPGESPGRIAIQKNSDVNVATRSIGHGISVTPMQLAVAYAAVANGGYRIRPHLVAAVESPDGTLSNVAVQGERILRPEVVCILKNFMRDVVCNGTAKTISDSLYPIAGKTGTAEKPNLSTGHYDKNKFMASFVGFYPADQPRLLGLVVLDQPEPIHYGGITAAPVLLNTIRRGTASDNVPAADMRHYCIATDSVDEPDVDWSRRLVEAVGPWLTTTEANAASDSVGAQANVSESGEPSGHPAGETGWDRMFGRCVAFVPDTTPDSVRVPGSDPQGMPLLQSVKTSGQQDLPPLVLDDGIAMTQEAQSDSSRGGNRACRLIQR